MRNITMKHALLAGLAFLSSSAVADPCGMVPPIYIPPDDVRTSISRIGAQRTYVSFRSGIETIALRPGFAGSVDEFGMLIPFPSPPAVRKIEDDTFSHLEAALAPPKVQVQIYDPRRERMMAMGYAVPAARSAVAEADKAEEGLRYDEVRVLRQEAVGMYQVAVLEAGSPAALQKWMTRNDYRYPEGMDDVTGEYLAEGWCFVAIKATVGQGAGVRPRPGMRSTDPALPAGASFDGHVQGMAFRFRTEAPVVPMRLSVFNGADPRNVVYMLTDEPVKINGIDDAMVLQQISGKALHANLTEPLQVLYSGGKRSDVRRSDLEMIEGMRTPEPYMHVARDLIAADLLAARQGELSLPFEEEEKELLAISESLGLRGADIDALHAEALAASRALAVAGALDDLDEMHLTVIDGVYPGALLASTNLTFSPYVRPGPAAERWDPLRPSDLFTSVVRR